MRTLRKVSALVLGLGMCATASAQSFNIDMDTGVTPPPVPGDGVPSAAFAAAGSAGTWNSMEGITQTTIANLLGLNGAPTGASLTRSSPLGGNFAFNNVNTTGDRELLLDDGQDLSAQAVPVLYNFTGLQPGPYRVFTYAVAPDVPADLTIVTVTGASPPNPQTVTGPIPPAGFVQGFTHAVHDVVVTANGQLQISADGATANDFGTVNGIQLVFIPEPASFGALAAGALLLARRRR